MSTPFRQEALDALREAPAVTGQVLKSEPRWLSRASSVVVAGGLALVAFLVLARVNQYATGPALVLAANRTNLAAPAAGVVDAIFVRPGQRVEKGAPLVVLDAATETAALEAVDAEFRQQLHRCLSQPSDLPARQALATVQSRRLVAQGALNARTVRAPADGVVSDLRAQVGQHVGAGDLLLALSRADGRFEVVALLPGHARPALRLGQQLQLRIAGHPAAHQWFRVTDVAAQIVGPSEARRYLGPAFGDSIELNGPRVVVRAEADVAGFVEDGETMAFFDGLQGTAEVATRQASLAMLLMPWLKEVPWR